MFLEVVSRLNREIALNSFNQSFKLLVICNIHHLANRHYKDLTVSISFIGALIFPKWVKNSLNTKDLTGLTNSLFINNFDCFHFPRHLPCLSVQWVSCIILVNNSCLNGDLPRLEDKHSVIVIALLGDNLSFQESFLRDQRYKLKQAVSSQCRKEVRLMLVLLNEAKKELGLVLTGCSPQVFEVGMLYLQQVYLCQCFGCLVPVFLHGLFLAKSVSGFQQPRVITDCL